MALLAPARRGVWNTFQPSQAPLGLWLCETSASVPALLGTLTSSLPGLVFQVGLSQQDPDFLPRPFDRWRLRTSDYIQTARISIQDTFDGYWAARGKNLRHNMKRQRNSLERAGTRTRLEVLRHPEQMAVAIRDYGALESAGWKAQGGTAVHVDNAQGRFYTAALENACRAGHGRVYRYFYDERLVAVDLCVDQGGSLVILKTTYDEAIQGSSPALLMRFESFPLIFAEGSIRRIEFYGRLMEWHTRWSEEVRTLYHVTYDRFPLLARAHRALRDQLGQHRPSGSPESSRPLSNAL